MSDILKSFFDSRNIEYFSVLSYSDCIESAPDIMERESFVPRSVILYLLPYYAGECDNISCYAASLDYHKAIAEVNSALAAHLRAQIGDFSYRGYGDHSPIDERHAALSTGLGILGDSGLLINEKYGTYVFIGDTVTDIEPERLGASEIREIEQCIHCGACKSACPTGILRGESCECLSAITQRKGDLTPAEQSLMREYHTAWGCDLCQSSCPYNKEPRLTPIEFFYRDRIESLTRARLDAMSRAELSSRAFGWRGRQVLLRNLEILSGDNEQREGQNILSDAKTADTRETR